MRYVKFFLMLLFVLMNIVSANNMHGIFWQPQVRDLIVSNDDWAQLMGEVHRQGIDTLVLQWTQYDDAFKNEQETAALLEKVSIAQSSGLEIIVGLSSENQFFDRQHLPLLELEVYLNNLAYVDIQQFLRMKKLLTFEPKGWYISAEIDDYNWRDEERRALLMRWLSGLREVIGAIEDTPIYISSFFSGNMAPQAYQELIVSIEQLGLNIWIQDGTGVNQLTQDQRLAYLGCDDENSVTRPAGRGIINEIFMIEQDGVFIPKPINTIEQDFFECGTDNIIFSLRYLQNVSNPLQY